MNNKIKKSDVSEVEKMRHTLSHVLAQAVLNLFPKTKLGIGPAIENGFYYDFEFSETITDEVLPKIEKEMKQLIKNNLPIKQEFKTRGETIKYFKEKKQTYKLDLIKEIPDEKFSFYISGENNFVDLCRGPHLNTTGEVKAFKLTKIAGAYWKGDEKNPMLTRIYGIGFENEKELKKYEEMMEEAAKRDHRKLGKNLDLFSFHEEGPGFVFWHPRGLKLREKLIEYWREVHEREEYEEIKTPTLLSMCAWDRSGHTDTFLEKMFLAKTHDDEEMCYALKPMNCDGGMLIFKSKQVSYKDLPIKMGEMGTVYRYESSGEIHGLMRAREFTQDDAHIYCTKDQIKDEFKKVIRLALEMYDTFGLELSHIEFSTRPEKSIGSDEIWQQAENTIQETIEEEKTNFQVNEGDGAFYGPKLDFHLKDAIGRTWQCATIQLDFAQPDNFDLNYINENGEKVRPVMIHRTVYGSLERFLAVLLEHYAGKLPLWLAPDQIAIVPIAERHLEYANTISNKLKEKGFSCRVNYENDTMQSRIRESELMKIPYILVVGDKEEETQTVSIRPAGKKELGIMKIEELLKILKEELASKSKESAL
jgi:threonyl-tRNA synthetase